MRKAVISRPVTTIPQSQFALDYRAELRFSDTSGRALCYYDSGALTPYCLEGLVETVTEEARAGNGVPVMTLEIVGPSDVEWLNRLARGFAGVAALGARIEIRCGPETRTLLPPVG